MKNLSRLVSAMILVITTVAGCGGGDDPDFGSPGNGNILRARVDGQPFSADSAFITITGATPAGESGLLLIVGSSVADGSSLVLNLGFITGTGTYPMGTNPITTPGGIATYSKSPASWSVPLNGRAGSVTITTRTSTRIAGTFGFEANGTLPTTMPAQRVVTQGEFDITVPTGLPSMPLGVGSTASAIIGGNYAWNASTVVAVAAGPNAIGVNANDGLYSLTFVPKTAPLVAGMTYGIPSAMAMQVLKSDNQGSWYGGVGADVGTFTVTAISSNHITATFNATLPSLVGGAVLAITGGNLDARLPAQAAGLVGVQFSATSSPLYGINAASGAGTLIGPTGFARMNSLSRNAAGLLVAAADSVAGDALVAINPVTGAGTQLAPLGFPASNVRALAFSPADVLFGIIDATGSDNLYTINTSTGAGTLVGSTGLPGMQGMDFSPGGQLFGWDVGSLGNNGLGLVSINTTTGVATDVNPGTDALTIQSIAFHSTGALYGVTESQLYSINPTTGAATVIGGSGYTGLRGIEFTN